MKIGVIADIHGNIVALRAVLQALREHRCDEVICLGDVATLGPSPVECLEAVRTEVDTFIAGNHELALLHPQKMDEFGIFSVVQPDVQWCLDRLPPEHLTFLSGFVPELRRRRRDGSSMLFCHGAPGSPTGLFHLFLAPASLRTILAGIPDQVIVNGHLHQPFHETVEGRHLFNPGSVGLPFKVPPGPGREPEMHPHAEFGLIIEEEDRLRFELCRVPYDHTELRHVLEASSLPGRAWWLRQLLPETAGERV